MDDENLLEYKGLKSQKHMNFLIGISPICILIVFLYKGH